jgi:hypothetical protein
MNVRKLIGMTLAVVGMVGYGWLNSRVQQQQQPGGATAGKDVTSTLLPMVRGCFGVHRSCTAS